MSTPTTIIAAKATAYTAAKATEMVKTLMATREAGDEWTYQVQCHETEAGAFVVAAYDEHSNFAGYF